MEPPGEGSHPSTHTQRSSTLRATSGLLARYRFELEILELCWIWQISQTANVLKSYKTRRLVMFSQDHFRRIIIAYIKAFARLLYAHHFAQGSAMHSGFGAALVWLFKTRFCVHQRYPWYVCLVAAKLAEQSGQISGLGVYRTLQYASGSSHN